MTEWLGLPPLATTHGGQVDSLIGWTHIFMLVLFVGWGAFFTYVLIRFRRSRHPVASYPGVKSHASSYLEGAVLVVEMVLLVITLVVQGGFVGFFLYLRKHAKRIADVELDAEWAELQRGPRTS